MIIVRDNQVVPHDGSEGLSPDGWLLDRVSVGGADQGVSTGSGGPDRGDHRYPGRCAAGLVPWLAAAESGTGALIGATFGARRNNQPSSVTTSPGASSSAVSDVPAPAKGKAMGLVRWELLTVKRPCSRINDNRALGRLRQTTN